MGAMLGKTVAGHGKPCVRVSQGCTCYFFSGENGTRTRAVEKRRRRRRARRREERTWQSQFNTREYP